MSKSTKNLNFNYDMLIQAYRNVKVDSFYETGHLTALAYAKYEENLEENLTNLLLKFQNNEIEWFKKEAFVGSFRVMLKSVKIPDDEQRKDNCIKSNVIYSNQNRSLNKKTIRELDYRIIGHHSIDFHVLSALWIELVGKLLDKQIGASSYGCRLKGYNIKTANLNTKNGHFRPYINDYQKWQHNGLEKITNALKEGRKVVAIMADIKKYYHRLDCSFLLDKTFLAKIDIKDPLNEEQVYITTILLGAIKSWSNIVYSSNSVSGEFKLNGHSGVPMGIGASKVIANLALIYLDKQIENEVKPIYYGRYVDDIFLVIEDGPSLDTEDKIWSFLLKRIKGLKKPIKPINSANSKKIIKEGYTLNIPYLKKSRIEFCKQKYFFIEGLSGQSLLNSIKQSLEETSSEWKLPPNPAHDIESIKNDLTSLNNDPSEIITSIGKSNGLSIQRNKFVLYLKRFETIIDILPKASWFEKVDSFIKLTMEYAINANTIGIFSKYYPKILALAIKTEKYQLGIDLINRIEKCYEGLVGITSSEKNKSKKALNISMLNQSLAFQKELLYEGVYSNVRFNKLIKEDQFNILVAKLLTFTSRGSNTTYTITIAGKLFIADLHAISIKNVFIQSIQIKNIIKLLRQAATQEQNKTFKDYFDFLWRKVFEEEYPLEKIPLGLLYYTRPFTLLELTILLPNWHDENNQISFNNLCSFSGIEYFEHKLDNPIEIPDNANIKTIAVDLHNSKLDRIIAFTSLETQNDSWTASVRQEIVEPDRSRELRILGLVAKIIECKDRKIDYVLFPELSIPKKLLIYISELFIKKGISLIAGVEYKHRKMPSDMEDMGFTGIVSNQLVYVLCVKGKTRTLQIAITQEKTIAAYKEETDLFSIGGKLLKAEDTSKYLINHGGFWFSGLICNDLLNIEFRSQLRGFIDALIVIEWNQDINTYDSLVEATSNDLHTFVLQVNNRKYGDTRLRGPYKEAHERDKVRVRGGELDYFVVATLEVEKLREFQRNHRSPDKPFKPMPTGFIISKERKKSIYKL